LTIGQVSSYGRLEVTALGDEMNEAASFTAVRSLGADAKALRDAGSIAVAEI
jgi:hypothetical protein